MITRETDLLWEFCGITRQVKRFCRNHAGRLMVLMVLTHHKIRKPCQDHVWSGETDNPHRLFKCRPMVQVSSEAKTFCPGVSGAPINQTLLTPREPRARRASISRSAPRAAVCS